MATILKIEDTKVIYEDGKKITRYIFNDDKVVRVEADTGRVITRNVTQEHLNLISVHEAKSDSYVDQIVRAHERTYDEEYREQIRVIQSGKGAGLGVLLGILLRFTIIGAYIFGFCSYGFLNDISDENYLRNTEARKINFRKGFYSAITFGVIIAAACCSQWKTDMISVLKGNPNKQSLNRHACYKTWVVIALIIFIFSLFAG